MEIDPPQPPSNPCRSSLVKRLFVIQASLIIATTALVFVASAFDLGFFWFSFIAGVFGSSLALLRRVQKGDEAVTTATLASWGATLMPFLYGGMLAAVAYFLFMSGILSGKEGHGILASNLFPDFVEGGLRATGSKVQDFLDGRPKKLPDAGKLIVWSFVAGYSENFVTGALRRLEKDGAS